MTPTIKDADFINALRGVVKRNPRHVYQTQDDACLYVHRTETGDLGGGCGIGQALLECGVPAETLYWYDKIDGSGAPVVLPDFGISPAVTSWADAFQQSQDTGHTWGQSLAVADAENPIIQ